MRNSLKRKRNLPPHGLLLLHPNPSNPCPNTRFLIYSCRTSPVSPGPTLRCTGLDARFAIMCVTFAAALWLQIYDYYCLRI